MTLRNIFLQSPSFSFENNIFYQRNLQRPDSFETLYLSLREKENRVYPDEIVKILPDIPAGHSLRKEWMSRKFTLQKLIPYLGKKSQPKILELGCGNGWLCNQLANLPGSEVVGVDVNEQELKQGSRVFADRKNICLAYSDIETALLPYSLFDYIILSASIQYFRDLSVLLSKLFSLLAENGEIHIVDSPLYNETDAFAARRRSEQYFTNAGFPLMAKYYHHHTWQELEPFQPKIRYHPGSFINTIKHKVLGASPFPWLLIKP